MKCHAGFSITNSRNGPLRAAQSPGEGLLLGEYLGNFPYHRSHATLTNVFGVHMYVDVYFRLVVHLLLLLEVGT